MSLTNFLKPNKEKFLITVSSFFIFYILDILVLSPAEVILTPEVTDIIFNAPISFWILRLLQELVTFYLLASFTFWFLNLKIIQKFKPSNRKSFLGWMKPNKINLILMLTGYAIFYITDTLIYAPLFSFYIMPYMTLDAAILTELVNTPLSLMFIRLGFDLVVFYLIAFFSSWLVYRKDK
ncbi:MAG: hypothetical protein HYW24_04870 [Candidatus Aenigmarchaeota archaeon]|nr:hypothetical protein [Candidatus Aenigmarchaeota archaeon]